MCEYKNSVYRKYSFNLKLSHKINRDLVKIRNISVIINDFTNFQLNL